MSWYSVKPDGWSEQTWRTVRTFVQTAVPALGVWLAAAGATRVWDWNALLYAVAIPALSAAMAAWANRNEV